MIALHVVRTGDLPRTTDPQWEEWLTAPELAFCAGFQHARDHLAARVAAKQALFTLLGPPENSRPWQDLEIRRDSLCPPVVLLHGATHQRRVVLGAGPPGVSLSHAGGCAAALAWLPGEQ